MLSKITEKIHQCQFLSFPVNFPLSGKSGADAYSGLTADLISPIKLSTFPEGDNNQGICPRLNSELIRTNLSFLKLIISWLVSFHNLKLIVLNPAQNFNGLMPLKRGFSRWHFESL
jgi:hypothetical protein